MKKARKRLFYLYNSFMETWKDIPGYNGLYQVSNTGKVKNKHQRLLKFRKTTPENPYYRVGLSIGNNQTLHSIHRLVLLTFNPHPDQDSLTVDHIDGKHTNNDLSNLRWLTREDNSLIGQIWKRNIRHVSETDIEVADPITNTVKLYRLIE